MAHEVSRHIRRALSVYANLVRTVYGDDVVSLVLFGGHTRGMASVDSDIDVGVIFKSIPDRRVVSDRLAERSPTLR
jgi:predicted nucleotidyltransferase